MSPSMAIDSKKIETVLEVDFSYNLFKDSQMNQYQMWWVNELNLKTSLNDHVFLSNTLHIYVNQDFSNSATLKHTVY